ncbi:MAG: ImmA/IrrE family metallo-endopeptidase [Deltaproteobacteria bacterium]|nr:ImmA/IrrE family metallo-endopeptidase [Deltaproteobacteria bacterium]MBN2673056.1 ImmA/IrrE family metallo-endopeptidase [Deltaproteobacteria bacterium]
MDEVAQKFKKSPDKIRQWESGEAKPTVKQARKLAAMYERAFTEFFLPEPPRLPQSETIQDFRLHRTLKEPASEREAQLIQDWAMAQRDSALDLYAEIREKPPEIDVVHFASITDSPEELATKTREWIRFGENKQFNLPNSSKYRLPTILRNLIESVGILTLKRSELTALGIRGLSIAKFPLPVIVLGGEADTAQAFTLAHELGHILLKVTAISGPRSRDYESIPEEKWCDQFAASFLMPRSSIEKTLGPVPVSPMAEFADEELEKIAGDFRVSPHAMLIRLMHLKYVAAEYYWQKKKAEFEKIEANASGFAKSKYYGSRYRNQQGDLFTGLVLEAWSSGNITNHHAAQYMGIKNIQNLDDIRKEYFK